MTTFSGLLVYWTMSWREVLGLLCVLAYRSVAFVLSHAGLMAMVVAYCLLGGVVFEALEREHELAVKDGIAEKRDALADAIWSHTESVSVLRQEVWTQDVERALKHFELELIRSMRQEGWNGDETHSNVQWTFGGALFYSVICITTIGYGDQTPKTAAGKLATVLYSVFGIPLMLFCLKTTGDTMASCFRFIYWRICCYLCIPASTQTRPQGRRTRLSRQRSTRSLPMHLGRSNSGNSNNGNNSGNNCGRNVKLRRSISVRSCNDQRRLSSRVKRPNSVYLEPGYGLEVHASMATCVSTPEVNTDESVDLRGQAAPSGHAPSGHAPSGHAASGHAASGHGGRPPAVRLHVPSNSAPATSSLGSSDYLFTERSLAMSRGVSRGVSTETERRIVVEQPELALLVVDDDEGDDQPDRTTNKEVPLWICGTLIVGYVTGGSLLFSGWEGWDFLDSAYFCFITLTTIGFGDFVPKESNVTHSKWSIAASSVYLLLGVSLLFMTFNLVQAQVVFYVRNIALKLGIVRSDDDNTNRT